MAKPAQPLVSNYQPLPEPWPIRETDRPLNAKFGPGASEPFAVKKGNIGTAPGAPAAFPEKKCFTVKRGKT